MNVNAQDLFNEQIQPLLKVMTEEGVTYAARGFSGMVGKNLTVSAPRVTLVPISDLPNLLGGPENEAVGIYLRAQGGMSGQIMLILPYDQALALVDLIAGEAPGTTRELGTMERSALAELGNMTGSFFLNAVAAYAHLDARPSPPAVMVDMLGAILDVVVASYGGVGKHALMIQVAFLSEDREVQADFWVIPDPEVLEAFAHREALHAH